MPDGEELLFGDSVKSWADSIESTEGIAEFEPGTTDSANQPLQVLDICHNRDDPLDIDLDIHDLSEDEQDKLSLDQYTAAAASASQVDTQRKSCPSSVPLLCRLRNRRDSRDFSSHLNRRLLSIACPHSQTLSRN